MLNLSLKLCKTVFRKSNHPKLFTMLSTHRCCIYFIHFHYYKMRPQWFSVDEIPFDHMWIDDKHWFPFMLKGDNNSKLLKKVSVSQLGNHLET